VSDMDSLIRERLTAAAAFDVVTDPRRLRENVVRRQRRIRRRRRTTVFLGVFVAAGIAVGGVRSVDRDSEGDVAVRPTDTTAETSGDAAASPGAPPYFSSAPGWETVQTGSSATAGNGPVGPDALDGNFPAHETIGQLQKGDVLLQAAFYPIGDSTAADAMFPPRELPLSLDDATPHVAIEGSPDVWADRLAAQVDGWNIDVVVFYGGTDLTTVPPVGPTAEARAAAQEQLARLVVPAGE
jgi:hypothetical protein